MKTIEINRADWTGQTETIQLWNDDITLGVYDEKYRINSTHIEGFSFHTVEGHEDIKGHTNEQGFTTFEAYGISRTSDGDPRIALAEVLFNIL